jgi:hypothetical protein
VVDAMSAPSKTAALSKQPPDRVFVGWCETCGDTIVADISKQKARTAIGCRCVAGDERVRSVRYQLAVRRSS